MEIGFKFQGFTKPFSSHTRVSTYNTADTVDQAHENSNDRETLLDDRTDFLEDERLRKAKEIREAEDDEYGSWELSLPKK